MSDRELDAEVAEKVMGWHRKEKGIMHGKPQVVFVDSRDNTRSINCGCDEDFNPSMDISCAMEVLDKADGLWELTRYPDQPDDAPEDAPYGIKYSCRLRFGDNVGRAIADTKERAICLAALAASKKGKVEN